MLGIALTAFTSLRLEQDGVATARTRFGAGSTLLANDLARRLVQAQFGLRGARSMMAANGGLTGRQFNAYVASRDLPSEFPGVRGFGFIERIARGDRAAYQARVRAEGVPGFEVRTSGAAPDLLVVRYVEPLAPNLPALGYDIGSDAARRLAAEAAVRSGELTLTPPLVLVQDARGGAGWLLYLPVYRAGAPVATPAQREAVLAGLLYAPITADEVLGPLRRFAEGNLEFRLTDTQAPGAGVLFDSRLAAPGSGGAAPSAGRFRQVRRLPLAGRVFALDVASTPAFDVRVDGYAPAILAVAGSLLTALLALALAQVLRARERAERQSREARADLQRMTRVVAGASSAVAELDVDLCVRWANEGFARLVGATRPACVGRPVRELLGGAGGDAHFEQAAGEALASGRTVRVELTHVDAGGHTHWLDTELQPSAGGADRAAGLALIALDVTERQQAEQRLREREHLIGIILENIPARITYWDPETRCRLANRQFAAAFGLTPDQLVGRAMVDILRPEIYERSVALLRQALGGAPLRLESPPIGTLDQGGTWLVSVLPDLQDGRVVGVFAFAIDVTQLKQAQEEAERASAAKTQFLSNMSHELRTPMNAVIGMLQLLRMTPLGARQSDYVGKAEGAARALLSLLNDVLDFSKIEAGKMTLDPRPFTWRALLADLEVILTASLGEKPVALRLRLDPQLPAAVCGDDLRLKQVLMNLGSNAIKFTPAGEVVVEIRQLARSGDSVDVEIAVTDTGIGISSADQERIFAEFSQAAASTTRQYGGTGLGLSICSRLVHLMGGTLGVASEPRRGSRFHVRLALPLASMPEVEADRVAIGVGPPAAAAEELRGLRILVAEDNAINQQVARELLQSAGAEVEIAANGREAMLAVAGKKPFDLVLMDVQMPVMDGLEATRRIRRLLQQHELPIVAVTANAMDSDRAACRDAGMNDHVGKPYARAEIVACILHHVRRTAPALPPLESPALPPRPIAVANDVFTDREAVLARLGGDESLHARLLPLFFADLQRARDRIDSAFAGLQPADVTRLFHSLKSTAATLGAQSLAACALEAEAAASQGDAERTRAAAGALRSEIERALRLQPQPAAPYAAPESDAHREPRCGTP